MRNLILGLLAHVDAGKTTLSEALLYECGKLKKPGRVDNGDAFLDTDEMERERGITIFSKQARFQFEDLSVTLMDTPGHVDFSTEMERTLQVLDYAVLIISASDGVQAHTRTLWRLLKRYRVPVFLFVNKMDQTEQEEESVLALLQENLDSGCVDFRRQEGEAFWENISMCDEKTLENFLRTGSIPVENIRELIADRKVFPVFFGSALKMWGIRELLAGIYRFSKVREYSGEFGARVYKITRDAQGNRLTCLKVTGGFLKVRDVIGEEKVSQLRIYSGDSFKPVSEVPAGEICAAAGLMNTFPGQGLGYEEEEKIPVLEPVLTYKVVLPAEMDPVVMLADLRQLEEEDPQLHLCWNEETKEIQIRIMGEVQLSILQRLIKNRFGVVVEFTEGSVVYKETIAETVIGIGHFEPLKHYTEVHLLIEPQGSGSGISYALACREDLLSKNWQRLVLTHLQEKEFRGVLTGSMLTDVKFTLVAGKAHEKHTEGGDFRQATYRAVRQGLMEADSILLEPFYAFRMQLPEACIGRAMMDVERRFGTCAVSEIKNGQALLLGQAPVSTIGGYQKELTAYTRGLGSISCTLKGYYPCHNTEEVVKKTGYDPLEDVNNPSASVFCAHGSGYQVPWYEVKKYRHVDMAPDLPEELAALYGKRIQEEEDRTPAGGRGSLQLSLGTEEIDSIIEKASHANKKQIPGRGFYRKEAVKAIPAETYVYRHVPKKEEYLLVDGYNIIFAWEELKEIAKVNIDGARGRLMDILCDYQAMVHCHLIVVFDAYRVKGHQTEISDYHNIHVVFTKEAETADQYIEKFAHENGRKLQVTVATSDGLEQIIITGQGCSLLSAREFAEEIQRTKEAFHEKYLNQATPEEHKRHLLDDFLNQK
ncbi:MAG: NYN domain-containing protein [Lachnospiraceae bacterium]